jgi:hypothetical protein
MIRLAELYQQLNAEFVTDYEKRTGRHITVVQSHGGSSRQARTVISGAQGALAKAALGALAGTRRPRRSRARCRTSRTSPARSRSSSTPSMRSPPHSRTRCAGRTSEQRAQALGGQLTAARAALLKALPTYGELAAPNRIGLSATSKLLGPDSALVSYFVLDDRVRGWLVLPNGEPLYRDTPIKHDDLKKIIGRLRVSLAPDHPYDVADAFALNQLLLQPFAEKLTNVNRLIVVRSARCSRLRSRRWQATIRARRMRRCPVITRRGSRRRPPNSTTTTRR